VFGKTILPVNTSIGQYLDHVIEVLIGELVNRSIPHISLNHVTRFEPITAAHFGQRYNNNDYFIGRINHVPCVSACVSVRRLYTCRLSAHRMSTADHAYLWRHAGHPVWRHSQAGCCEHVLDHRREWHDPRRRFRSRRHLDVKHGPLNSL